jgi:hypothetical protein
LSTRSTARSPASGARSAWSARALLRPAETRSPDLLEHAPQAGASRADLAVALGRALSRRAFDRGLLRAMAREYGTLATQDLVESAIAAGDA